MAGYIGYRLDFFELTCQSCGKVYNGKSKMRKYCDDCRHYRHLEVSKENKQREQEKNRESLAIIAPPARVIEKPQYTLSEVAAAARKHGMTYGNYVFAWKSGTVASPEKFPKKKKRGRKKIEC